MQCTGKFPQALPQTCWLTHPEVTLATSDQERETWISFRRKWYHLGVEGFPRSKQKLRPVDEQPFTQTFVSLSDMHFLNRKADQERLDCE